jgi:hypothetical protein
MGKTKSVFKELASINVNSKLEKKGSLSYLSWSYAWAIVKDKYPDTTRKVYECESTGLNYFTDGKTAYVKVGVTINGTEHIDYLPIMLNNNKSMPLEKITSFDVNKTIQRSTVKAIGYHGLGLSVWAGEDLVDVSEVNVTPVVIEKIEDAYIYNSEKFKNTLKVYKSNMDCDIKTVLHQVKKKHNPDIATLNQLENELNKIKTQNEKPKTNAKSVK